MNLVINEPPPVLLLEFELCREIECLRCYCAVLSFQLVSKAGIRPASAEPGP